MSFNSESVIDMDVIASLRELGGDDDPELLSELIELFLDDAPSHLEALDRGLIENRPEVIEHAAHTLKSSCANIGALQLSNLCRELETMGRTNTLEETPSLVTRAQQEYVTVKSALEALRG